VQAFRHKGSIGSIKFSIKKFKGASQSAEENHEMNASENKAENNVANNASLDASTLKTPTSDGAERIPKKIKRNLASSDAVKLESSDKVKVQQNNTESATTTDDDDDDEMFPSEESSEDLTQVVVETPKDPRLKQQPSADVKNSILLEKEQMNQKQEHNIHLDNSANSQQGEFGDEIITLPEGVVLPPSVTPVLLSDRLRKMLFELTPQQMIEALSEYDDAVRTKSNTIRNRQAYLNGVLKRYISVLNKVHQDGVTKPMGSALTVRVQERMRHLIEINFCTEEDLMESDRILMKMKMLPEKEALAAIEELLSVKREQIRNFGSYFMGILNRYMRGEGGPKKKEQSANKYQKRQDHQKDTADGRGRFKNNSYDRVRGGGEVKGRDDFRDGRRDFDRNGRSPETDYRRNDRDRGRDHDRDSSDRRGNKRDDSYSRRDRFSDRNSEHFRDRYDRDNYDRDGDTFRDRYDRDRSRERDRDRYDSGDRNKSNRDSYSYNRDRYGNERDSYRSPASKSYSYRDSRSPDNRSGSPRYIDERAVVPPPPRPFPDQYSQIHQHSTASFQTSVMPNVPLPPFPQPQQHPQLLQQVMPPFGLVRQPQGSVMNVQQPAPLLVQPPPQQFIQPQMVPVPANVMSQINAPVPPPNFAPTQTRQAPNFQHPLQQQNAGPMGAPQQFAPPPTDIFNLADKAADAVKLLGSLQQYQHPPHLNMPPNQQHQIHMQPGSNQQMQPGSNQQMQPGSNHQMQPGLNQQVQPGLNQQMQPGLNQQMQHGVNQQMQHGLNQQMQAGLNQQMQPGSNQQMHQDGQPRTEQETPNGYHAKHHNEVNEESLPMMIQLAVKNLAATGHIEGKIDRGIVQLLARMPSEQAALDALNKFSSCSLHSVRNKNAYLAGILRKLMDHSNFKGKR